MLKRCTSSTNSTVSRPAALCCLARAMASRISFTPDNTADNCRKWALAFLAGGYPRQRGLADAGGTPENHRVQLAAVMAWRRVCPAPAYAAGRRSQQACGAQPGSQRLIAGGGFARGGGRLRGIAEKAGLGRAGDSGLSCPESIVIVEQVDVPRRRVN